MNLLDTLARAEAVVDLLRVNLAGDFCADLASNRGPTLIEAKQDSGVAACELVEYLIRSARQEITARFAEEVANAYAADQANAPTAARTPAPAKAKKPRKDKPAATPKRATKKGNGALHAVMDGITLAP